MSFDTIEHFHKLVRLAGIEEDIGNLIELSYEDEGFVDNIESDLGIMYIMATHLGGGRFRLAMICVDHSAPPPPNAIKLTDRIKTKFH